MTAAGIEELTVEHSYPTGTRLPVPISLGMEDSFWGYLHSVARWYSYPSPMMLLQETKTHRFARTVRVPLDPLARLLKIPVSDLERRTYWRRPDKTRRFFDGSIGCHDLSLEESRICPECLREGRAHSALFDIAFNTVCDRHSLNLLSKCPKCRRRLDWKRKAFERCTCGFNLDRIAGDRAGPAALRYARLLRRAAGLLDARADSDALDMGTWPHDLLSLDLKTLCGVVNFFLLRDPLQPVVPRTRLTLDVLLPHIEHSLGRWFDNWPTGAAGLFERVRQSRISRRPRGLNPFSRRHSILRAEIGKLIGGEVPAFLDQARNLHLSATLSPRHDLETIDGAAWISVAATARRLRIAKYRVLGLCRDGHLLFHEYRTARTTFFAISADSVMAHAKIKENAVGKKEARDLYGLSPRVLLRLVDTGYIRELPNGFGFRLDATAYDRVSIENLLSDLNARVQTLTVSERSNRCGEKARYFPLTKRSTSRVKAVQAAAQGRLRLFRVSPQKAKRFSDFLVYRNDVVLLRAHEIIQREGLGIGAAARRVGYGPPCFQRILKSGFVQGKTSRRGVRIPVDELVRFASEFVRLRDIASCNGIPVGKIALVLRRPGIRPVRIPKWGGKQQTQIFRRSEIAPLIESKGWQMPPIKYLGEK